MTLKNIGKILLEIGFVQRMNHHSEPGVYYEFEQEYPDDDEQPHGSNLYVSFEDYHKFYIHFNVLNVHHYDELKNYKTKEQFLEDLDRTVLAGKHGWIYEDRGYYHWAQAADEQRKRYFETRMKMKLKPCKEILDHIKEHGTDHVETMLDFKYKNKRIGEMSWDDLANALIEIKKTNKEEL